MTYFELTAHISAIFTLLSNVSDNVAILVVLTGIGFDSRCSALGTRTILIKVQRSRMVKTKAAV